MKSEDTPVECFAESTLANVLCEQMCLSGFAFYFPCLNPPPTPPKKQQQQKNPTKKLEEMLKKKATENHSPPYIACEYY